MSTPSLATTSVLHGDITNSSAAELRRKCSRERYASLSVDQKEARNKKAREYRQQKEASQGVDQSAVTNVTAIATDVENAATLPAMSTPSPATTSVLHGDITNPSVAEFRRKRARERYTSLSVDPKDARNKKACEYRQRKKEASQCVNQSTATNVTGNHSNSIDD